MSLGGERRPEGETRPARRNWTRVVASWFVVFFIVASWSILFRAVSPVLFGSDRHNELVLNDNDRGDLCIVPLRPGFAKALSEAPTCEVSYSPL